jgi:hypothetical protein
MTQPPRKLGPLKWERPEDREYKGLSSDSPPQHDPTSSGVDKLTSDWNKVIPGRNRNATVYTDPADIWKYQDEPILVRRRHNMHICGICGLRLGDFGRIANVRTRALNTVLFRTAASSAITLQAVADTINMIKGDKVVNLEWVIKYFRHDISDLTPDEISGSFSWQVHSYSRKVSEKLATQMVKGMQHMIRQRIRNERMIRTGVVPYKAVADLKTPEQLHAEVAQATTDASEEARRAHMHKIKSNKVQILGSLIRKDGQ